MLGVDVNSSKYGSAFFYGPAIDRHDPQEMRAIIDDINTLNKENHHLIGFCLMACFQNFPPVCFVKFNALNA